MKSIKDFFTTIAGHINRSAIFGTILFIFALVHVWVFKDAVIFGACLAAATAALGIGVKEDGPIAATVATEGGK